MMAAISLEIDRFLRAHFSASHRFLVACSGGPDSVALVRAMHEIAQHRPLRFEVGHVNHHLRGAASNADERFVRGLGRTLGVRVHVASRTVRRSDPGNLEERARDARYAALAAIARRRGLNVLLTAHTVGDQAETILMNMVRGAGPDGLVGIRPIRKDAALGLTLARPMLSLERKDVQDQARRWGSFRSDRSNRDQDLLRNYVRLTLFEGLRRRQPGFESRMGRLAALMRDELPLIDDLAEAAWRRTGRRYRRGWLIDRRLFEKEPVALQRRILRKAAGIDLLRFEAVEKLRQWMHSPPTSGRRWQLRKGWFVERLSRLSGSPSPALFWFRQTPPKKES